MGLAFHKCGDFTDLEVVFRSITVIRDPQGRLDKIPSGNLTQLWKMYHL